MSLADRLSAADREFSLIVDRRARLRGGNLETVQVRPTKMRLPDAALIDWLLSEHVAPTALVMPRGTVWVLSEPGDGVVWYVSHGKPSKTQSAAIEAILDALAQEFPDVDVPLLDDEPTKETEDE
jgi:hypothetical protein